MSLVADDYLESWAVDWEAENLSPAARTVYAMAVALTYETQDQAVAVRRVMRGSGVSPDEWDAVERELYEAGLLFRCDEGSTKLVSIMSASGRLSSAMGAAGRPSGRDWEELRGAVFQRHGRLCIYCGSTEEVAVDHVTPLNHGGSNHICNLVPACKSCNSAKGGRTWGEWCVLLRERRGRA